MGDSSLRSALLDTISGLLSPDIQVRSQAEEQVKALEVTDDYGVHLTELTLEPTGQLAVRQLAAVMLKQYIDVHWSCESDKFRAPETPATAKQAIRNMLPLGLKESISKVRNTVAFSLAGIAHWDWPDHWPQLFDVLMEAMRAEDEYAVQGAVRVLKELARDLTDSQIPTVAPVILPDIYRIFCESERFTVRTRARAVEIFTTLTSMICTMGEVNKSLQKSLLNPVLTTFSEALVAALCVPDSQTSDPGLRTEVLKALTVLVKNVPKQMATWLPQILPPVWSTLTTSAEKYVREVVNEGGEEDDVVDSDGEVLGFENLVFAIFEFVHALVETNKFKGAVKAGLSELVYYIVLYMQITEEQCQKWSDNPDSFVEDEDEDTFAYSVRISSQDLLMALCEEFEVECCASLAQAVTKHVTEAGLARSQGRDEWWKVHEAAMLALGSAQEVIESQIKEGNVQFDISSFMTSVVLSDLNSPVHPFLLGRCLWVGSKFPSHMEHQAITSFLEGTVRGLQQDQPHPVRISAVRAIWGFCNHLRSKPDNDSTRQLLVPLLPALVDGLVAMATNFSHSSEILGLILENLAVVLACDPKFTAGQEAKVSPLAIAMFLKYNSDPVITSLSQDIFKVLSANPACSGPLQGRLVPPLISILNASDDKNGLKGLALDVLSSLVRSAPLPLSDQLMMTMFPAAIQVTLTTDDNTVLQAGGECLRSYIAVSPDQVASFTDNQGKSGVVHIIAVAEHLLNPTGSEYSATFVGRLVTTLIQKVGARLGEHLDLLLKAVLSKLQGAKTLSVIQSLIMVYAQLVHSQMDAVLMFLSNVPGPTGNSALHFVMSEWVAKQPNFYGSYESKVSTTALAKLLQHGVNSNDTRLTEITVKGDQVFSEGRSTRSSRQNKPEQWTEVPLLAKLLKLLINEIQNLMEENVDLDDESEDDEEWEGDSQDSEGSINASNSKGIDLSKLLAPAEDYLEDVEEEDPDCKADPVYSLDIKQYLLNFLREFTAQPCFSHFAPHLNQAETQTLHSLAAASV